MSNPTAIDASIAHLERLLAQRRARRLEVWYPSMGRGVVRHPPYRGNMTDREFLIAVSNVIGINDRWCQRAYAMCVDPNAALGRPSLDGCA